MLIDETDFKAAVPIGVNFEFARLTPDVKRAQLNFIRPILGIDLESILEAAYSGTPSADEQALIQMVHPSLAHLTLWKYIPKGNVHIGNNGIQSTHSGNVKPAFQWQKDDLEGSARDGGFDALEELIEYLESVANTDFPDWLTSDACTLARENFVNTAKKFTESVPKVKGSRFLFIYLRPILSRIEKSIIKAVTGTDLYDELKTQIKADNLSVANLALMEYIEPAVCHATWASALFELGIQVDAEGVHTLMNAFSGTTKAKQAAEPDRLRVIKDHHEGVSNEQLRLLQEYLVANVGTYPLYEDGETYDADDTDPQVVNDPDGGLVSLGL